MNTSVEANRLAKQLITLRKGKIKKLKDKIDSGQYAVSNKKIAKILVFSF